MKILPLPVLFVSLICPYCVKAQEWKKECVGYYQLQLPDNLEVAVYPVEDFVNPDKQPESDGDIKIRRYAAAKITFRKSHDLQDRDATQAQFTEFYYGDYRLGVSSESKNPIDFAAYRMRRVGSIDFNNNVKKQYEERDLKLFKKPLTSKAEFERIHGYLVKQYPNAFTVYDNRGYIVYINSDNRLYHFWSKTQKDTGDKSQAAEKQLRDNEPEVLSLLNRFHSRKLYEVPAAQGFCLPYGFISGDSRHEKRNMAVTYRLKDHPDVTIFFQDLGMEPSAGFQRPENESAKDFVTYLWNRKYQWSSVSKELINPKWRSIKMDGRNGLGTFVRSTFKDGSVDYGYVAYVQGNHKARNLEPDLLLYVMQDSRQVKNQSPLSKDELKNLAEHIVSSVKRR